MSSSKDPANKENKPKHPANDEYKSETPIEVILHTGLIKLNPQIGREDFLTRAFFPELDKLPKEEKLQGLVRERWAQWQSTSDNTFHHPEITYGLSQDCFTKEQLDRLQTYMQNGKASRCTVNQLFPYVVCQTESRAGDMEAADGESHWLLQVLSKPLSTWRLLTFSIIYDVKCLKIFGHLLFSVEGDKIRHYRHQLHERTFWQDIEDGKKWADDPEDDSKPFKSQLLGFLLGFMKGFGEMHLERPHDLAEKLLKVDPVKDGEISSRLKLKERYL
ncbi:hypothetical protein K470DRAFT_290549 [Piedraia hortae CBS 480.64]|uniref:DUF7924 domain-containing protein n=1 Tax=Piedraia hortae CBS 480.64 TaxID=1314780 RepID=A0A6A7C7E8_9PEZI|nr:hypothetical protein K470DRAFT_290549 [Piedraia hortae CBS 480.64]